MALKVSLLRGSEAQLNGQLSRDFTSSCRTELLRLLKRRELDDDCLLTRLLFSTDEEVVLLALECLASRATNHDGKTSLMLRELSRGWPPLDLISSVSGEARWSEPEFLKEGESSCLEQFNRLVRDRDLVDATFESRFRLLTRVRFARAFHSTETRHSYVKVMVLALQLQRERKLMPGQLRKLVKSQKHRVPDSIRLLALETLTAYGKTNVFSSSDRERKVEEFLSRNFKEEEQSLDSGFVEALLLNSFPVTIRGCHHHRKLPGYIISSACADNVFSWLEEELGNSGAAELKIVESLLVSQEIVRPHHRNRLHRCLLQLFRSSEAFGARAFDLAASLLTPSVERELGTAFAEAMLSVAIPSGWQVSKEESIALFFSLLNPELEAKAIQLVLSDVEKRSWLLRHAVRKQAGFMSSLLAAGGRAFIRQLPASVVEKMPEFPLSRVSEEIAMGLSKDLDDGMNSEKLAMVVADLDKLVRLGGGGVFLAQLGARDRVALERRLVAMFDALAWPLTGVCFSSLMGLVVDSPGFPGVELLLDSALGFHGSRFFTELAGKWSSSGRLMVAAWRRACSDVKRQVLTWLLLSPEPGTAAVFTGIVSSRGDVELVPGLGKKVLEMLRSSATSSVRRKELTVILNHVLEVLELDPDKLFIPRHEKGDPSSRLEALAWYRSSLQRQEHSVELLKLGVTLTRDSFLAEELLSAWGQGLPHLVDTLLEAAAAAGQDDPLAKQLAARTVVQLLEGDPVVLYLNMVYRIQQSPNKCCGLDEFLRCMVLEALREPLVFLRACSYACDFTRRPGMVMVKSICSFKFPMLDRPRFHQLFSHLLSSRGDSSALELLSALLQELPVSVQAAINAGVVERLLVTSISEPRFSKLIDILCLHSKAGAITQAFLTLFSKPHELDKPSLINALKRVARCGEFVERFPEVFGGIVGGLKLLQELDLDHPETQSAAASVVWMILRSLDREAGKEEKGGGGGIDCVFGDAQATLAAIPSGHACFRALSSRLQQMPGSGNIETEYDLLRRPRYEDGDIDWTWKASEEELKMLARFVWLPPGRGSSRFQTLLAQVFVHENDFTAAGLVPGVLVRMLVDGGGIPKLVVRRVVLILWRLFRERAKFISLDERSLQELIAFLLARGHSWWQGLNNVRMGLLEGVVLQLQKRLPNLILSPEQLRSLCHIAVHSSDTLTSKVVSLARLDAALSLQLVSCVMDLSTQIMRLAWEKLERGDHSSSACLTRLARMIEGLPDVVGREHAVQALAPLGTLIPLMMRDRKRTIGKERQRTIEALLIAESLKAARFPPSQAAVELLRFIARSHPRLVKLALPLLRRWPMLESLEFSTKLACLRDRTVASRRVRKIRISRANILQDSFTQFSTITPELLRGSSSIRVDFLNEPGVDLGGLKREWYLLLSRAIGQELFTHAGNPNPSSKLGIPYFKFAGRLVAKAIVDDERLDLHLSPAFYKHLLGQQVSYLDIEDPEHLRSINWLLENHVDESMGLTFSLDVHKASYDLVAGGSDIPVTDVNKHEYISLLGECLLTGSIRLEIDAFREGFYEVLPADSISRFLPSELELMICGLPEIRVEDLQSAAKCRHDDHILDWFWEVVAGFDNQKRALLLKFITGSSQIPVSGDIRNFYIKRSNHGEDHLPSSHTCAAEINIPSYKSKEQLQHKLLQAIHEETYAFY